MAPSLGSPVEPVLIIGQTGSFATTRDAPAETNVFHGEASRSDIISQEIIDYSCSSPLAGRDASELLQRLVAALS